MTANRLLTPRESINKEKLLSDFKKMDWELSADGFVDTKNTIDSEFVVDVKKAIEMIGENEALEEYNQYCRENKRLWTISDFFYDEEDEELRKEAAKRKANGCLYSPCLNKHVIPTAGRPPLRPCDSCCSCGSSSYASSSHSVATSSSCASCRSSPVW